MGIKNNTLFLRFFKKIKSVILISKERSADNMQFWIIVVLIITFIVIYRVWKKNNSPGISTELSAAEQGDDTAQYQLGLRHLRGEGVNKDAVQAVKWLSKAATQGNADAQYVLGLCYYGGSGVSKNMDEAQKWLREAAKQGDTAAQDSLAEMFQKRNEVTGGDEFAERYHAAARKGYNDAQSKLDSMKKLK